MDRDILVDPQKVIIAYILSFKEFMIACLLYEKKQDFVVPATIIFNDVYIGLLIYFLKLSNYHIPMV